MSKWTEIAKNVLKADKNLPIVIQEPAQALVGRTMGVVSEIVGSLHLVYLRGHQVGYEEGYQDGILRRETRYPRPKKKSRIKPDGTNEKN